MSTAFEQSIRQTLIAMAELQRDDIAKRYEAALELANTQGLDWHVQKRYSAMLYRVEQLLGQLQHDWREARRGLVEAHVEDGVRKAANIVPACPSFETQVCTSPDVCLAEGACNYTGTALKPLPDKLAFLDKKDEALLPGTRVLITGEVGDYKGQTAIFHRMAGPRYECHTTPGHKLFLARQHFVVTTSVNLEDHIGKRIYFQVQPHAAFQYTLNEVRIGRRGNLVLVVTQLPLTQE